MSGTGANMYRVGDFVYFEDPTIPDAPYQVRRIDELNKTPNGVEARVVLYLRRRDISSTLLKVADQAVRRFDNYYEADKKKPDNFNSRGFTIANGEELVKKEENDEEKKEEEKITEEERNKEDVITVDWGNGGLPLGADNLTPEQRLRLRQHELFLSRQSDTMLASHIRGKCRVTLLSEIENCDSYLNQDDIFFYSLVYDPTHQTLLADKGAIRVGDKYQAAMDDDEKEDKATTENGEKMEVDDEENGHGDLKIDEDEEAKSSTSKSSTSEDAEIERDVQVYHPYHKLTERDIDQFLIIARAVGTFARAIDSSSAAKIPTLHMAAASASRDITILHAMSLLHHANYDIGKAVQFLVPPANRDYYPLEIDKATGHQTQMLGGPLLCRDQMEEWSTPEANLFDEALEKCGKDFNDIRVDYLPWKSMRDIVEYYYQYKSSNRYVERKKNKQAETEGKLKQVYIPSYNKGNMCVIGTYNITQNVQKSQTVCENCKAEESQNWYCWGGKGHQTRLCQQCWIRWKKHGGLDRKHEFERFDKNRPPVAATTISESTTTATAPVVSRPLTQTAVVTPIINKPTANPNQQSRQVVNQQQFLAQLQNPKNQNLMLAMKQAAANGTISLSTLQMLQQQYANANAATPSVNNAPNNTVAKPPAKPNIVFYTTICRRVLRRVLPRTVYNPRRMARKPFSNIDLQEMSKCFSVVGRDLQLQTARGLAGSERGSRIVDQTFMHGMVRLQQSMNGTATKRPATASSSSGEPMPKMQKPPASASHPLEDVGNTLIALNQAMSTGKDYVHEPVPELSRVQQPPQPVLRATDSRWFDSKQHGLTFIAGRCLKADRLKLLPKGSVQVRIAKQPYKSWTSLDNVLARLYQFAKS